MNNFKRLTVTAALPYANGYLHLGHIAGAYLPSDMYVRYQRLKKQDVIFICGSDEYGTAIEMSAIKENVTPKEIIDRYHFANKNSFDDIGIKFDIYSRTSNEMHTKTAQEFFLNLYKSGILYPRTEKQLYSEKENRFLADRFVEGTCPVCGYVEARGDQCENCGTNLSPLELINPRSKVTGDTPIVKESTQLYFKFSELQDKLKGWVDTKKDWKANVKNYSLGWLKTGLNDRAVTRDLKWGVPVPIEEYKDKIIYVWIEAPVGYISATKELFAERNQPDKWESYWKDKDTRLIHFIGKDNIVFHAILFPAMLMAHGGYVLPDYVDGNEFLNVEGKKFSKSQGRGFTVREMVDSFNPDSVRYAIASSMPENKDSDFTLKDLQSKNNNELGAILGNFVNRTFVFAEKYFDNTLPARGRLEQIDMDMLDKLKKGMEIVSGDYENFKFREAVSDSMNIVRDANKYFNDTEPWKAVKENKERCGTIINICLHLVYGFGILFNPVIPFASEKILAAFSTGSEHLDWENINNHIFSDGMKLNKPVILFSRIEEEQIIDQ